MLQDAELRCTAGRFALLETLIRATGPLTQDQIAAGLRDTDLNKTTIYRALTSFMEAGIVHQAFYRDRAYYYELACNCGEISCHPHFICTACGKTNCLTDVSVPLVQGLTAGFVIQRQKTELKGLCPRCNRHKANTKN